MKALVFRDGLVAQVEEVPEPTPGQDEVVVRVEGAGICHTDLDILHGRYPAAFPRIPGHEFAGEIVAVGDDVPRSRLGERVAVDPLLSCGTCRNCTRGYGNLCPDIRAYGSDVDGGIAEFAAVRASNVYPIGALPSAIAALAEPVACVVNAIERTQPRLDDRVAVIGAGPMGMLLGVVLAGYGVSDLTVIDVADARLQRAKEFGFTKAVLSEGDLLAAAGARSFDIVIDATGRPDVVQQSIGLLADAGKLVPFGVCPPGSTVSIDPNAVYARQLQVIGSFSLAGTLPRAIEILQNSNFDLAGLVTHSLPLIDAEKALASVGSPDSLKIQISPAGSPV